MAAAIAIPTTADAMTDGNWTVPLALQGSSTDFDHRNAAPPDGGCRAGLLSELTSQRLASERIEVEGPGGFHLKNHDQDSTELKITEQTQIN